MRTAGHSSTHRHGAFARARRLASLALALSLAFVLSACLFETAAPVFGPGDATTPAGLAEVYRLPPVNPSDEAAKPFYLRLRPSAAGGFEATLYGLDGEGDEKIWRAETYEMRFVALGNDWYVWELAEPPEANKAERWYGLFELGARGCRWIDSFPNTDPAEIGKLATSHGLVVKDSLGPSTLEGDLSPAALKDFFRAIIGGPGATAPMGTCEPSGLPPELKASMSDG